MGLPSLSLSFLPQETGLWGSERVLWDWDSPEGPPEGHIHFGHRGLAGDIGHFNATAGILGELQTCSDGHTFGRGIDVAPIIAVKGGVHVHPSGRLTEVFTPLFTPYSTVLSFSSVYKMFVIIHIPTALSCSFEPDPFFLI